MSSTKEKQDTHTLNGICPYFTMFPLSLPLSILKRHATEGEWVLDPFCGRGTTNYASRSLGLPSIGIDSSPVAVALSEAKLANATPASIIKLAQRILDEISAPQSIPQDEFWQWAYEKSVLRVICRLREGLLKDCRSESRKALRAILLGALHGPVTKTFLSYLSNQCPRTYAPKPKYSVGYWKKHQLLPPKADVMNIITRRANRYYPYEMPGRGQIIFGDSRSEKLFSEIENKYKWVITSPPYYGMRTYLPDQWIRLWFLGGKADVDYSVDGQVTHTSQDEYADDLKRVWRNVAKKCTKNAKLVVRFGCLNSRQVNALDILRKSFKDTAWSISTLIHAGSAAKGKRQSLYFLEENKEPFLEYDIWAVWNN